MDLNELRKIAEAATPGPWHWSGNADNQQLYLATWIKGAGRCQVMDFERWGMQRAVPRFLDDDSLMMETAKDLMVYEVARNQNLPDDTPRNHPKVYRADVVDVRHPNARFMAAANPETVLALIDRLEQAEQDRVKLRNRLDAMRRQRDGYQNQLRKTEPTKEKTMTNQPPLKPDALTNLRLLADRATEEVRHAVIEPDILHKLLDLAVAQPEVNSVEELAKAWYVGFCKGEQTAFRERPVNPDTINPYKNGKTP